MKTQNIVILNDIRSVENVGAIFRTSDALGIDKIYITGYTPAPVDRFGRKRTDLAKSALGAEETMLWEQKKSIVALITKLKKEGYLIIAVEQDPASTDYKKIKVKDRTVFIMGNEVEGLPESVLKMSDQVAEIPMQGKKESLNVSVAFGVALFRILT